MADPTPPSDLPDPASPNPQPGQPGAAGPRRIRSMPERMVSSSAANVRSTPERPGGPRPAASIRSVPTAGEGPRPSGTYAATLSKERSWKRGLSFLWLLFLVAMALEALSATFYLLVGKPGWPPVSYLLLSHGPILPVDLIRLALVCVFFVGLWVGQGWLRYVFGTVSLLSSVWLFANLIVSYHWMPKFKSTGETDVPILWSPELAPKIALAVLYLILAAYVIFSVDVKEFVARRRADGGLGGLVLATVVAFGCLAAIVGAPQPLYNDWLQKQHASAVAFGEETLRKMSADWSPTSIDDRIDPEFAKSFTPDGRKSTFANFKDLGHLREPNTAPAAALPAAKADPLHNVKAGPPDLAAPGAPDIASGVTADGSSSVLRARYNTTGATFEHGKVRFAFDLVREGSNPWRITKLDAADVNIERPAPPAPPAPPPSAPTPAADGTVPAASPAASVSTAPTDAAAPTPAATPAVAPAASPSPTTGG